MQTFTKRNAWKYWKVEEGEGKELRELDLFMFSNGYLHYMDYIPSVLSTFHSDTDLPIYALILLGILNINLLNWRNGIHAA